MKKRTLLVLFVAFVTLILTGGDRSGSDSDYADLATIQLEAIEVEATTTTQYLKKQLFFLLYLEKIKK